MKASKCTEAQKAFVIKQGEEGSPMAEVCRKAGISQATYFDWKKRYAGLLPTEMRRLRELEDGMLADWGMSIGRACRVDTSTYHYSPTAPIQPCSKSA